MIFQNMSNLQSLHNLQIQSLKTKFYLNDYNGVISYNTDIIIEYMKNFDGKNLLIEICQLLKEDNVINNILNITYII